jgi:hypothetical protein
MNAGPGRGAAIGRGEPARGRPAPPTAGVEGNEVLTSAAGLVLLILLLVEAVTIVHMSGLMTTHMFVGLVLIPAVALKLASTGYRMVKYYAHDRAYRAAGPPLLPLRVSAPVLVASVVVVLTTGVLLLAAGHKSSQVLTIHKVATIVFGVLLAVHLLAYTVPAIRTLGKDLRAAPVQAVVGRGTRGMLVAVAVGGGAVLALALLGTINSYGH